jgi:hypothetical protein
MNKSLFQIEEEYLALMAEVEDCEGVLDEELENRLSIAHEDYEKKMDAYAYRIKQIEAQGASLKEEAKRLNERAKALDNQVVALKNNMVKALNMFGDTTKTGNRSIRTEKFTYRTIQSEAVVYDDKEWSNVEKVILDRLRLGFNPILENENLHAEDVLQCSLKGNLELKYVSLVNNYLRSLDKDVEWSLSVDKKKAKENPTALSLDGVMDFAKAETHESLVIK